MITSAPCASSLPVGASCVVTVSLATSGTAGSKVVTLQLGASAVASVSLVATMVAAATVKTAPTLTSFGSAPSNTTSGPIVPVNVTNVSASPVPVSLLTLGGPDVAQFVLVSTTRPVGTMTLAPGASCTATFRFAPTTPGAKTALLNVGSPILSQATLTGTGT
jgi:hypothetical protein